MDPSAVLLVEVAQHAGATTRTELSRPDARLYSRVIGYPQREGIFFALGMTKGFRHLSDDEIIDRCQGYHSLSHPTALSPVAPWRAAGATRSGVGRRAYRTAAKRGHPQTPLVRVPGDAGGTADGPPASDPAFASPTPPARSASSTMPVLPSPLSMLRVASSGRPRSSSRCWAPARTPTRRTSSATRSRTGLAARFACSPSSAASARSWSPTISRAESGAPAAMSPTSDQSPSVGHRRPAGGR